MSDKPVTSAPSSSLQRPLPPTSAGSCPTSGLQRTAGAGRLGAAAKTDREIAIECAALVLLIALKTHEDIPNEGTWGDVVIYKNELAAILEKK